MIPLSVLDLSPIVAGRRRRRRRFRNTLDLAQHAERWGYRRFWLAEHHNMPGIASAATAVVIGHVAGGTSTIRVGAGGIMLPNHAPLVIAEQFGTLESLYPGPHRPRPRPRAGHRPAHRARAAPRPRRRRDDFPAGRAGAAWRYFDAARAGPARARRARARARTCRSGSSARASSARSSPPRSACRTRSPRTSRPRRCCTALAIYRARFRPSEQLDAAVRHARRQRLRRRHRRGGAAALHLAAAGVRQPAPRPPGPLPPPVRRHRARR